MRPPLQPLKRLNRDPWGKFVKKKPFILNNSPFDKHVCEGKERKQAREAGGTTTGTPSRRGNLAWNENGYFFHGKLGKIRVCVWKIGIGVIDFNQY